MDKDPALVTDNARNMIVAGLEAEMRPHLACFAHALNLASQKALQVDTAAKLLEKVRRVVGFLHRNIRGAEILREKQQQLSLLVRTSSYKMFPPDGTAPLTCCSGSWSNSQLCLPLSCPGRS